MHGIRREMALVLVISPVFFAAAKTSSSNFIPEIHTSHLQSGDRNITYAHEIV